MPPGSGPSTVVRLPEAPKEPAATVTTGPTGGGRSAVESARYSGQQASQDDVTRPPDGIGRVTGSMLRSTASAVLLALTAR